MTKGETIGAGLAGLSYASLPLRRVDLICQDF
jgi:hypothetical protein